MDKISETIKNIIKKHCAFDVALKEDTNLVEELGFDSISMVILITDIESNFGIEFDIDDLKYENITVYGNILKVVVDKCHDNM